MDLQKKFAVWFCCMALAACVAPATKAPQITPSQQQVIASDLVGALVQIEQLPTSSTTLNLASEKFGNNVFSAALQSRLEEAGYGIRSTGSGRIQQLVDYSIESRLNEAGRVVGSYTVTIGRFSVQRSYEQVDAVQLKPLGSMQVKGANAASLEDDDASAYRRPIRNYRELGKSNFADLLATYRIVDENILLFGNDSVRLGQVNKMRISQLVSRFDAKSDVFSVIGCSNGSTSAKGGPQVLALGRGERVRQELLYAGIPDASILHEGCWSDAYYDEKMPRRGVVISLQRRIE